MRASRRSSWRCRSQELMDRGREHARRSVRDPGHVLAQGVHPAHDAVPRPVRLLHLRQGARPRRARRTSRPTKCSRIARRGAELGCHEALFTLGEAPEARYPAGRGMARGQRVRVDGRLPRRRRAQLVLDETGLLPHANAGALAQDDLERLRAVSPSQGMMIETLAARLGEPGGPHYGAPDKTPERRLATLEAAGRAARAVHHRHPRRHRRDAGRAGRRAGRDRRRRIAGTVTCRR